VFEGYQDKSWMDFMNVMVISQNKGIKVIDGGLFVEIGSRNTKPDPNAIKAGVEGVGNIILTGAK